MPNPGISPTTLGATTYTITNSKGMIADMKLDVLVSNPPTFEIQYPTAATTVQATLIKGGVSLNLLPGPVNDSTKFTDRRIIASTSPAGSNTVLSCTIRTLSGEAMGEDWTVHVSGLAGNQCQFTQPDNHAPPNPTITRIMCDPVANFTISPGTIVKEKQIVTLTANSATAGTVVKDASAPSPIVYYTWSHDGSLAIPTFNTMCGQSPISNFTTPNVSASTTFNITEEVWFDSACPNVGFLNNTSASQSLTIQTSPQVLLLVLDRTGSMTGSKWENAKTAARILARLFIAFRSGVNPNDKIGVLLFDDSRCNWATTPDSTRFADIISLESVAMADSQVCSVNFGNPGDCTNIGDALIKGMQELTNLNLNQTDGPNFNIILITDGIENSGLVRVDLNTNAPNFVHEFANERNGSGINSFVNTNLKLFTVGVGSDVNHDVLQHLATQQQGKSGEYESVITPRDVVTAIIQEVNFSGETQQVLPLAGAPPNADPNPPSQARYFQLASGANRLAVTILSSQTASWDDTMDTISLAFRPQGNTGAFTPVNAPVKACSTFGFVSVDVAALFTGQTSIPATEWRIVHSRNMIDGFVPLPIASEDLLIVEDLFVKAEIIFDKAEYRTGDPMHISCLIAAGSKPVTNTTVTVTLERPGIGLGTFLATTPLQPPIPITVPSTTSPVSAAGPGDPLSPKYTLLRQLLRQQGLGDLPILRPPAIFPDGTAQLFDDGKHSDGVANDGVYANTYTNTDKEGVYTFRFLVEGKLPDGSVFNRLIILSKWIGINVDPVKSLVAMKPGPLQGSLQTALVSIRPQDSRREFLGPFRTGELTFKTTAGSFQGNLVTEPDGTYSQTLTYSPGQEPFVTVATQGKLLSTKKATNSGFLIQSTFGVKGNFELVVPHPTAGIIHCVRDNDDSPNFPWKEAEVFGTSVGKVDAVSLIQSNFGLPGHLEVVARCGDRLVHFWRDSGPTPTWHSPATVLTGVSGNPALIQGHFGTRGNFELVVPLASGGIAHYWRNNDMPATFPWNRGTVFGRDLGDVDAVSLIQSNFGQPGNLEVVARVENHLFHFWRDSGPQFTWHGPLQFFSVAAGIPGFIQSNFGTQGHFEVVTPVSGGGMVHLQRNNDGPAHFPWSVQASFGSGKVTAVSLLQSNFTVSRDPNKPGPGDLEVAARIDGRTAHYWRADESPFAWEGPTAFACS